jgi:hypothetical protein
MGIFQILKRKCHIKKELLDLYVAIREKANAVLHEGSQENEAGAYIAITQLQSFIKQFP